MLKSEIRNPKSEINPKSKFLKQKFCYLVFMIGFSFVIRHSSFVIFVQNVYAQPISSTELISNAAQYDGKTVEYEGEVVGEVMRRGAYAWVNINDGANAIGIWSLNSKLSEVNFTGSYKTNGDRLRIKGQFNRACLMHGGDLDIHAEEIIKIKSGELKEHALPQYKQNLVIYLSGVLLCLLLISLILKPKQTKK
ncbi:MAG: DNA-binding protein [Candidatus Omnitrophota bacterium]